MDLLFVFVLAVIASPVDDYDCDDGIYCTRYEWVCDGKMDCLDGSDENETMCNTRVCLPETHSCGGGHCIPRYFVCDGLAYCRDESDEQGCDTRTCLSDEYDCGNGQCINRYWVCDGISHCGNEGDEQECSDHVCRPDDHSCGNGRCLPRHEVCDGIYHCPDFNDEWQETCSARVCKSEEFDCTFGQCIPRNWVCDGKEDCKYGNDEELCEKCLNSSTTIATFQICDGKLDCPFGEDETTNTCIKCDNSTTKLPKFWICDGIVQCPFGDDESTNMCMRCGGMIDGFILPKFKFCDSIPDCASEEDESRDMCAQCTNSSTNLARFRFCDGMVDCPFGEDELTNMCKMCAASSITIARFMFCDGIVDCPGMADERPEMCTTCINSSKQIAKSMFCDGTLDCPFGEDESTNICNFHCNMVHGSHLPVLGTVYVGDIQECLRRCWETEFCVFVESTTQGCVLLSSWAYHNLSSFQELDTYRDDSHIKVTDFCEVGCHGDECFHLEDAFSKEDCSHGTIADRTSLDQLKYMEIARPLADKGVIIGIQVEQGKSNFTTFRFVMEEFVMEERLQRSMFQTEYEVINNTIYTRPNVYLCKMPRTNTDVLSIEKRGMFFKRAFKCGNGDFVHGNARCDGIGDCLNEVDETFCPEKDKAHIKEDFQCMNGESVPYSVYCDFVMDCKDGSDEACVFTECRHNEIRCHNGQCVAYTALCNGQHECFDASDELQQYCESVPSWWQSRSHNIASGFKNMTYAACDVSNGFGQFRCQFDNELACLYHSQICDGKVDCPRANDERLCSMDPCPSFCTCITYEVRCSNLDKGKTMQIANSMSVNTRYLDISGSKGVDTTLFDLLNIPLTYLAHLDMSRNDINLKVYVQASFANMPNLVNLILSQNNISDMQQYLDVSNVQQLDLSHNIIAHLNLDVFGDFQNLKYLNLSNNLIESIKSTTYDDLETLHNLDLSYNHISDSSQLDFFQFHNMKDLRVILLNNNEINDIRRNVLGGLKNISLLNLSHNKIAFIDNCSFSGLETVRVLDLSFNKLLRIQREIFCGIGMVYSIDMSHNEISSLEGNTFSELKNFSGNLMLNNNRLKKLQKDVFGEIANLRELSLVNNKLLNVEDNAFRGIFELEKLDISENNIQIFSRKIFGGLPHLETLRTDDYKFCCVKPNSVTFANCYPKADEFSSCENLMRNVFASHMMFVLAICAIAGNVATFVFRTVYERQKMKIGFGIFVTNLSVSDFIMGVYLAIIAGVDIYYQGSYIWNAQAWQTSALCNFAGVISTLSSEASVFFICLITLDRFFVIKWPLGKLRFGIKSAVMASLLAWLFAILVAILPILYTDYFGNEYYSVNAVCIALPLTRARPKGWEYSLAVFVFFNFLTFVLIAIGQIMIFVEVRFDRKAITSVSARRKTDLTVARNLLLVVLTDFLCWVPVGVMGIMALTGYTISGEVNVWAAVFILPVNAALNPVLYTVSAFIKKEKFAPREDEQSYLISMNMKKWKAYCQSSSSVYVMSATQRSLKTLIQRRCLTAIGAAFIFTELARQIAITHEAELYQGEINLDMINLAMSEHKIVNVSVNLFPKTVIKEENKKEDINQIGRIGRILVINTEQAVAGPVSE